jgi:nucleoside-diphosphate-sugar epimerase
MGTDVLILGGTGVLGRAVLPHLAGREVIATTRSPEKLDVLRGFGVRGAVCDVYDHVALTELMVGAQPDLVVNFLTDLSSMDFAATSRIRHEGGPKVVSAARAAGARRLVVESIAFAAGDGAVDLELFESSALESGLEVVVLRCGLFWGPGTWYETEPDDDLPHVHIEDAGRQAMQLLFDAAPGVYELVGSSEQRSGIE